MKCVSIRLRPKPCYGYRQELFYKIKIAAVKCKMAEETLKRISYHIESHIECFLDYFKAISMISSKQLWS